jgi:hypothetical protein
VDAIIAQKQRPRVLGRYFFHAAIRSGVYFWDQLLVNDYGGALEIPQRRVLHEE